MNQLHAKEGISVTDAEKVTQVKVADPAISEALMARVLRSEEAFGLQTLAKKGMAEEEDRRTHTIIFIYRPIIYVELKNRPGAILARAKKA